MTHFAGIFGYPLAHSVSPAFQQAAFDYYSLPVRYQAWPTRPECLKNEVLKLHEKDYLGANVTVPYKEQVRPLLDSVDTWTRSVGAVNTIAKEGGQLVGYNTDVYGFMKSLKEIGAFDPRGKNVLLLGAGGAARAAVFGLLEDQVATLTIANRTYTRARCLADDVRSASAEVTAIPMEETDLKSASARVDLIVNSTSIGMWHGDADGTTPLDASLISSDVLVYDMVYNPTVTPLLAEARKAGARTLGGLSMLIYQGAAAFERWTGADAPIDVMFRAGEDAVAGIRVVG